METNQAYEDKLSDLRAIKRFKSPSVRLHHAMDGTFLQVISFDTNNRDPLFAFVPVPEVVTGSPESALQRARLRKAREDRYDELPDLECAFCLQEMSDEEKSLPFCRSCREIQAGF